MFVHRPWYVETSTPEPKDVVIVIDHSGSMNDVHDTRSLMDIAKDAALTVLNTMNPNDRVKLLNVLQLFLLKFSITI